MLRLPKTEVKKVFLPTTASLPDEDPNKVWVVVESGPIVPNDLIGVRRGASDVEVNLALLSNRIKDWNYTDETGSKLPINKENIGRIHFENFNFLVDEAEKESHDTDLLSDPEKKV